MMQWNILIVDNDPVTLALLRKRIKRIEFSPSVLTAKDGTSALRILKKKEISLILADLQMPGMDGFVLLNYFHENYPDIPVIVMTSRGRPGTQKLVLEKGAAAYMEKPLNINDVIDRIVTLLQKETEGGSLFGASLEVFVQLIEMEQKTATLRVIEKHTEKKGVLFFENGELLDARSGNKQGEAAAYEIFSWDQTILYIENGCALKVRKIVPDLQAILFEAMRLKDETVDTRSAEENAESSTPKVSQKDVFERIQSKMMAFPKDAKAVESIKGDNRWNRLMQWVTRFGLDLQFGRLLSCYIQQGEPYDTVVVPGDETIAISLKAKCFHDIILESIEE